MTKPQREGALSRVESASFFDAHFDAHMSGNGRKWAGMRGNDVNRKALKRGGFGGFGVEVAVSGRIVIFLYSSRDFGPHDAHLMPKPLRGKIGQGLDGAGFQLIAEVGVDLHGDLDG